MFPARRLAALALVSAVSSIFLLLSVTTLAAVKGINSVCSSEHPTGEEVCSHSSPSSHAQNEERQANSNTMSVAKIMRGVLLKGPGGPEMLQYSTDVPVPAIKSAKDVLVKVAATAINRADTMQRKGMYPAPAGASELLGLEAAGVVEQVGEDVKDWKQGDKVMALLSGGGYAEYVVAHESHCMPIPKEMPMEQAAAIPEVFLTAWQAMRFQSSLQSGQHLLVHAGASGVGTAACQLAKLIGAKSVTTSSEGKVEACKKFADFAVSRTKDEEGKIFAPKIESVVGKNKIDVIIDPVFGGGYLEENAEVMNLDGQVVVLAFMGGNKLTDFVATPLFRKRAGIKFSTLRSQSDEYKGRLVSSFTKDALAGFSNGTLTPVVDTVMPIEEIVKAHQRMDASDTIGKIVLKF